MGFFNHMGWMLQNHTIKHGQIRPTLLPGTYLSNPTWCFQSQHPPGLRALDIRLTFLKCKTLVHEAMKALPCRKIFGYAAEEAFDGSVLMTIENLLDDSFVQHRFRYLMQGGSHFATSNHISSFETRGSLKKTNMDTGSVELRDEVQLRNMGSFV